MKGAYEQFMRVLDFDPVNSDFDEMENIRETHKKSIEKIYRRLNFREPSIIF